MAKQPKKVKVAPVGLTQWEQLVDSGLVTPDHARAQVALLESIGVPVTVTDDAEAESAQLDSRVADDRQAIAEYEAQIAAIRRTIQTTEAEIDEWHQRKSRVQDLANLLTG